MTDTALPPKPAHEPLHRFDVVLVNLDPSVGAEIKKTRPCLVVSPDELNDVLQTIIVAPITSTPPRTLPTRIQLRASEHSGLRCDSFAVLDQIKSIDRRRVITRMGRITPYEESAVTSTLLTMFA